jgi:uncharacterized membrane protein
MHLINPLKKLKFYYPQTTIEIALQNQRQNSNRSSSIAGIVFVLCNLTTIAVTIPLLIVEPFSWEHMNYFLLAGTLSLAVGVFVHSSTTFSLRDAVLLLTITLIVTTIYELMGLHWGIPFGGTYRYNEYLKPILPGGIPLFIPFAWYVIAYASLVYLRRFITDNQKPLNKRLLVLKAVVCAILLTAVDLVLDPLATNVETWVWFKTGPYFGIPTWNFIGWFIVGFVIYFSFSAFGGAKTALYSGGVRSLDGLLVTFSLILTILANLAIIRRLNHFLPLILTSLTLGPFCVYWFITAYKSSTPPKVTIDTLNQIHPHHRQING